MEIRLPLLVLLKKKKNYIKIKKFFIFNKKTVFNNMLTYDIKLKVIKVFFLLTMGI